MRYKIPGSWQNGCQSPAEAIPTTKENGLITEVVFYNFMVNHRVVQVETLLEVMEDMDTKLKALDVIEMDGVMTYESR